MKELAELNRYAWVVFMPAALAIWLWISSQEVELDYSGNPVLLKWQIVNYLAIYLIAHGCLSLFAYFWVPYDVPALEAKRRKRNNIVQKILAMVGILVLLYLVFLFLYVVHEASPRELTAWTHYF